MSAPASDTIAAPAASAAAGRPRQPASTEIPRPGIPGPALPWPALRYFDAYRVVLAGLMLALVFWGVAPRPIGHYDTALFGTAAIGYFAFAVAAMAAAGTRWPGFDLQVFAAALVDIAAIVAFMHASGGVRSGFGVLLVVATAGAGLLSRRRFAILFAALGSLGILGQQVFAALGDPFYTASYPHAGMLGAALFAAALLGHFAARRIRASEALAERRGVDLANLAQLNEHIVQRMQSGIVAIDAEGRVRLMNEAARGLLALGPVPPLGMPLGAAAPDLADLVAAWRRGGADARRMLQPRGGALKLNAACAAIGEGATDGVLVFLDDASAVQQRAQQLKLASLGRLAAGIAHEIRNPLAAISHAGQLLEESPGLDPAGHRLTRMIRENSARMNAIVENVLGLGRGRPAQPELFVLAPWLEDFAEEFCRAAPRARAALERSVEPADLAVRCDRSQLRQVLWNLCENALRHAGEPPRLCLHAALDGDTGRPRLDVLDNGPGIDEQVRERLFEPFYTTRSRGTGLGLYVSRELCEGNRAALNWVPGETGCRFRITFAHPDRETGMEGEVALDGRRT